MKRTLVVAIVVFTLLLSILFAGSTSSQTTLRTIYIQPDGTVYPEGTPIRRDGDTYVFTGNIYDPVYIQRAGIVLDGAGYTLQGPYDGTQTDIWIIGQGVDQSTNGTRVPWTIGIDLGGDEVNGITVRNLNIKNFSIGVYIWTRNNTFTGNNVAECTVGILLSGGNNSVTRNYIDRNSMGVFFGVNEENDTIPLSLRIDHNSFVNNTRHLSGCLCKDYNTTETKHTWDDGKEGNYWSDYNGTDTNGDGIGDTPYVVDVLNQDRYPLMQTPAYPPIVAPAVSAEMISAVVLSLIVVAAIGFRVWKNSSEAK